MTFEPYLLQNVVSICCLGFALVTMGLSWNSSGRRAARWRVLSICAAFAPIAYASVGYSPFLAGLMTMQAVMIAAAHAFPKRFVSTWIGASVKVPGIAGR